VGGKECGREGSRWGWVVRSVEGREWVVRGMGGRGVGSEQYGSVHLIAIN